MGFKAYYSTLAITLTSFLVSPLVHSQISTIEIQHENQRQSLQIPTVLINQVEYIDFPNLVELMGGASTVVSKRMRVDLKGTTAWVGLNQNRVNALSIFPLGHNIVANENGIYIALNDCAPFFRKAFRLEVSCSAPTLPSGNPIAENSSSEGPSEFQQAPPRDRPNQVPSQQPYPVIRTILIDPGHGGYEPGVEGIAGTTEKDIVLSISRKLETLLQSTYQLSVSRTRVQDTSLSPQQRNAISQNTQADLLVSIHAGGAFSEETQGIAIFYPQPDTVKQGNPSALAFRSADFSEESRNIASIISQSIIKETRAASRGIHPIPNALFHKSRRPSILIEVGCLTNRQEEALLGDELYQAKIAIGIANGIELLLQRAKEPLPITTLNNERIQSEITPL